MGVDNDMRSVFFGQEGSTSWNKDRLTSLLEDNYRHVDIDVRNRPGIADLVRQYASDLVLVLHCAAQPSHDWAAREPYTDFDINAVGTLNVLEAVRLHAPDAVTIFTSTNKVYGDTPNRLPLRELATRWELPTDHTYYTGIREDMTIDSSLHSLFGASKVAADVLVQEYGRYFGMKTACFRGGTLTGPAHSATELHGFLGYLMLCTMSGKHYSIFGHGGKQVRDAIHCSDLISAFHAFLDNPRVGEVYNIGGGRMSQTSVLEAIESAQTISSRKLNWTYVDQARTGDHQWWITDNSKFRKHYPEWQQAYDVEAILEEMYNVNGTRWTI